MTDRDVAWAIVITMPSRSRLRRLGRSERGEL